VVALSCHFAVGNGGMGWADSIVGWEEEKHISVD